MKGWLRNARVQALLGLILAGYLKLMLRTIRWRHENLECVEPVLAGDSGALGLFWHGRVPLCLAMAPQWWRKRTHALISPSADGEFLAQALGRAGFPAIRGSSAKRGDAAKARAVVAAFREALTWVKGGGVLIVTPDGPRGPNEVIAAGSLQIARRTGAPVFLVGIAASPSLSMNTWDRVMVAPPFARGQVVWDGPHHVPADADEDQVAALAADWSARLSAATRRAEALAAGQSH
ncbi:lysophospholipid acyltransferase family protein [Phenylobacterium sp.]|uniref:lysophospholipid acyltransferase family protein n=1 Tax=Phenylobacterium sp. TaxID=1871053 RepID=UPI0027334CBE|nr:lysophospholipid acyltransferase family protein [Phenylobacterium sp.]MDP3659975.1 lysophospholipid acyltransferase family protein [Phenylobacterium sp.]